jgi:hypothetical protein
MADSRESSCSTESSLAEQEYIEVQEQQTRDRTFNQTNLDHAAKLGAMRIESNARLAQYAVPPTPPTSRTDAMKLLEQLQTISTNLVEIGKSQVELSGRYMQCLRASKLIRNRLDTIGVTRDTHGLVFANQDEMIRSVAKMGCNRALRIFGRQTLSTRNKAKAESRIENVVNSEKKVRKPRAKKAAQPAAPTADAVLTQLTQYAK